MGRDIVRDLVLGWRGFGKYFELLEGGGFGVAFSY